MIAVAEKIERTRAATPDRGTPVVIKVPQRVTQDLPESERDRLFENLRAFYAINGGAWTAEALADLKAQGRHAVSINISEQKLRTLAEVGLGYLKLGQAANTLSGGEAQRLKLASELARRDHSGRLYVLDEPTTGLHWDDIAKLLALLGRLRDAGATLIVIEHHADVILAADHVMELGPEGGEKGGKLVYAGLPEGLLKQKGSPTGRALSQQQ
jgi:ABC-type multidrug transport system ATPase subunit